MDSSIQELNARIREANASVKDLIREIGKVIVGQQYLVDRLLMAILDDFPIPFFKNPLRIGGSEIVRRFPNHIVGMRDSEKRLTFFINKNNTIQMMDKDGVRTDFNQMSATDLKVEEVSESATSRFIHPCTTLILTIW